jgi:nicotinate-nucleotide adenylyltransferase
MRPIGVFGGTFDPIHVGHLRTAFELRDILSLAEVRFVPCGIPHDGKTSIAPPDLRLEMVRTAAATDFTVDERELHRPGPSYSIDTLESLRDEFPDRIFALIVGMDAFLGFRTWRRWEDVLRLAHLVVARRPDSQSGATDPGSDPELDALLVRYGTHDPIDLQQQPAGRILIQTVTQLEISSSAIRQLVAGGGDPKFLVPDAVRKMIIDSGCYRAAPLQEVPISAK